MKAVLFIALVASLFAACLAHPTLSDAQYQSGFTAWMHKHDKAYESHEFQFRFDAYKSNIDFINNWDAEKEGFEGTSFFLVGQCFLLFICKTPFFVLPSGSLRSISTPLS